MCTIFGGIDKLNHIIKAKERESKSLEKKRKIGLFIFRRDLRLEDNVGFQQMAKECDVLYPCFIFTPEQVGNQNKYRSNDSVQFMIESLLDLDKSLGKHGGGSAELYCFYGKNKTVISHLINELNINTIGFNRDYTPYAIQRDEEIKQLCEKRHIECLMTEDYYLYTPGSILNTSNRIYSKFTPFYQKVLGENVPKPNMGFSNKARFGHIRGHGGMLQISLDTAMKRFVGNANDKIFTHGGREPGLVKLRDTLRTQRNYEKTRNMLNYPTSLLSAYLKFGCISVREVYHYFVRYFGKKSEILRQLIWRDFYAHVLYGFPELVDMAESPPRINYKKPKWENNRTWFEKWCKGQTGYPIVDACMRQLNQTGWMHNRGRLIVSCFLVKTLLIDWKWGEQYFAKHLADYDVASNNGNWQWISSTGVDSMPYFRIFNPWTQSLEYDPEGKFIKTWVPELADVDPKDLHKWNESHEKYKKSGIKYGAPIVDFSVQRKRMLEMYK